MGCQTLMAIFKCEIKRLIRFAKSMTLTWRMKPGFAPEIHNTKPRNFRNERILSISEQTNFPEAEASGRYYCALASDSHMCFVLRGV
jgi:hypothetical protein